MQFREGSMFDPSTIPSPRPDKKTLYVLKQILHGFSDEDSLAGLKAIRAVMSDEVRPSLLLLALSGGAGRLSYDAGRQDAPSVL
jgi:hypothetical protein